MTGYLVAIGGSLYALGACALTAALGRALGFGAPALAFLDISLAIVAVVGVVGYAYLGHRINADTTT